MIHVQLVHALPPPGAHVPDGVHVHPPDPSGMHIGTIGTWGPPQEIGPVPGLHDPLELMQVDQANVLLPHPLAPMPVHSQ